ncbi:MAG: hypothetical protein IH820_17350 [Bacteroidetes bacterium]|nr:hypothetical protein [Bacteroidota bacterium]
MGVVVRMALQTGADRGVLVAGKKGGARAEAPGLRVGQLRIYHEEAMTQRYQQHRAALSLAQMQAIEAEMFGTLTRAAG